MKTLKHFLKEHKAWKRFRTAYKESSSGHLDTFMKHHPTIGGAFVWGRSKRGDKYWRDLDELARKEGIY